VQLRLQHVGRVAVCVCAGSGADAGVESAPRLAVLGRDACSRLILRSHTARSHRQPILARHGRKYERHQLHYAAAARWLQLGGCS